MAKRVGVLLAGSGYLDGAEIHEATLTLYFLDKAGLEIVAMAPDKPQADVVDHLVRLSEEIDTGRELLASTMETLLSQANNRLTMVTTRLTLIATIFLPLNFVAGFFGMNLEILPASVAVPLVMAAMVAVPATMYLFFRRRGWLT